MALLQRLAAVRGRLSLCADQAAAAKWWLSMPMASVSAEGPMPNALSTRRTSPLLPGCRHQGRACPLLRHRMTDRTSVLEGKRVSVRVDLGGPCILNNTYTIMHSSKTLE